MSLFDIILLAIALAMDCFTVSIVSGIISNSQSTTSNGAVENHCELCIMNYALLRMAFLFGLFQALMPLLGWLGISHFQSYMEAYDHWIAFFLLAFIGGKMVKSPFQSPSPTHPTASGHCHQHRCAGRRHFLCLYGLRPSLATPATTHHHRPRLFCPLPRRLRLRPSFRQGHHPSTETRTLRRHHPHPHRPEDSINIINSAIIAV